jgi:hypothetical protein
MVRRSNALLRLRVEARGPTKHIGSRALLIAIKIAEILRRLAGRGQSLTSVATIARRRKKLDSKLAESFRHARLLLLR